MGLAFVESGTAEIGHLLRAPRQDQERRGYRHTLREICQQPLTWMETAAGMIDRLPVLQAALHHLKGNGKPGTMVLTGSGSSVYAGECLAPALQAALGFSVRAVRIRAPWLINTSSRCRTFAAFIHRTRRF